MQAQPGTIGLQAGEQVSCLRFCFLTMMSPELSGNEW